MTARQGLRPDLPELPERMRRLAIDARGYPVPFFVEWVNGEPDFRCVDSRKMVAAIARRLCWLCGEPLGRFGAFVIGPMCALNRTTSEPPCHRACAVFAVKACPFLTRPNAERRTANLPEGWQPPAGEGLLRNPGVSLVWVTREWSLRQVENGLLFTIGDSTETLWYAEGREATRNECERSIETGLPLLLAHEPDLSPIEVEEGIAFVAAALESTRGYLPGERSPGERPASDVVREAMAIAEAAGAPKPWDLSAP